MERDIGRNMNKGSNKLVHDEHSKELRSDGNHYHGEDGR